MYVYAGETVRVTAEDLTHADSGAVTSGATLTVALYDAANTLVSTDSTSSVGNGDDWWLDITAPSTAGEYVVKVTATKSGATWKAADPLVVRAF